MPIEGTLDGLYVGADQSVELTVYQDDGETPEDVTGWTTVLDIRKSDTAPAAKLSASGVVSGTYNADPELNTQVVTFTLSATALASTVLPGDDPALRYSIWRTDSGHKMPLRFGSVIFTRVTRA
jgi:hypothetical protein